MAQCEEPRHWTRMELDLHPGSVSAGEQCDFDHVSKLL